MNVRVTSMVGTSSSGGVTVLECGWEFEYVSEVRVKGPATRAGRPGVRGAVWVAIS